jgi:FolB domain-containing protein
MDKIIIRDLTARCIIGINPEERVEKQDITINLTIHADLGKACRSDDFQDTLDYKVLKKKILQCVEDSRFFLIEALAQAVAEICLEHPLAQAVDVRVDKPGALRFARSVAVEITRRRGD